ncbi:hypothetical protein E4U30_002992 [Claviceps sp. LM220 group G6]|nr:hypothetical protein E4U15_002765 [Claviceps sp. LM218 group G6]KAG6101089.1 hypothetical protein E4U30_002992 [Claviceps sp. LM220 group G6]KAG6114396.1 hypothetical protein E4U31_004956 [Claviceps sp. LM219 group G6]KAG6122665.1 hypothetical protein E4U14_005796 [Claviceps sp. LM454 group G7]
MQFDPVFDMAPRSAFTWPGPLDSGSSNSSVLGADLNSLLSGGSEASLTPPPSESRSLASSPPRGSMTPDQHAMNQYRERSRRETKLAARMRRGESSSYTTSPPPMSLSDASGSIPMPLYSTTSPSMSMLPGSAPNLQGQAYMPSYNPSMQDVSQNSHMFTSAPFQHSIPSSYSMPMDYPTLYSGPTDYRYAEPSHAPHSSYSSHNPGRNLPLPISHDGNLVYAPVPSGATVGSTGSSQEGSHVRVVQSRPKPRCWDHGCNGRQFSTFSNLLRHQREKSGQATKATCPNCGAEFTRTTARNGHLLHDKCKQRKGS